MSDYFSLLNCTETSTVEEIKRNYQHLIKKCHPDKSDGLSTEEFINIDKAWKVLRDDKLRTEYINAQKQHKYEENHVLIYAELAKAELKWAGDEATYPCRCGSDFVILKEYLTEPNPIIECSECTNCIVIK